MERISALNYIIYSEAGDLLLPIVITGLHSFLMTRTALLYGQTVSTSKRLNQMRIDDLAIQMRSLA
ncbi:hypothetical protein M514_17728 [Trichuris suis]|uniref:Uncharacterized protein n=1 Tax=Trichuris suis TaxID=68888 RepID=A0A085NKY0_9BILA|nr:hypothetical protein M514_17728 [Trichuris suis]